MSRSGSIERVAGVALRPRPRPGHLAPGVHQPAQDGAEEPRQQGGAGLQGGGQPRPRHHLDQERGGDTRLSLVNSNNTEL